MSSAKWRLLCLVLSVLKRGHPMCHMTPVWRHHMVGVDRWMGFDIKPYDAETGIFLGKLGHYHGWCCPDSLYHQDISSHGVESLVDIGIL